MDKKVAIIILNWKAYADTFECLQSVKKLEYPYYHIFLADNLSGDGSYEQLIYDYNNNKFEPLNITFIQTGGNLGFAGGNNVAIKEAYEKGYDYFWLLNNDTTVDKESLKSLVKLIDSDSSIGIVGSKIYYFGTNIIWFAGGIINKYFGTTAHIGIKEEDKGQYDSVQEVDYITGCSLLTTRKILEEVGYMEEDYFLYFEETDWNVKIKNKGYKCVYNPKSVVYHKVSVSSGGEKNLSPIVAYYDLRNSFWMIKRNYTILEKITSVLYMPIKILKKTVKIFLYNQDRKVERLKYIYKGIKDAFIGG